MSWLIGSRVIGNGMLNQIQLILIGHSEPRI